MCNSYNVSHYIFANLFYKTRKPSLLLDYHVRQQKNLNTLFMSLQISFMENWNLENWKIAGNEIHIIVFKQNSD